MVKVEPGLSLHVNKNFKAHFLKKIIVVFLKYITAVFSSNAAKKNCVKESYFPERSGPIQLIGRIDTQFVSFDMRMR